MGTRTKISGMFSMSSHTLLLLLSTIVIVYGAHYALAQQSAIGIIQAVPAGEVKEGQYVMISVMKNGAVVQQKEVRVGGAGVGTFHVPAGVYDVQFEGAGMKTIVKRSIHVTLGNSTDVYGPMEAGKGR